MYVSITGLKVKGWRQWPRFAWHAVRSLRQARQAPGNLGAEVRTVDGVQHTLTLWQSREAMRRYLTSGAHLQAIRDFRKVGSGRTCGYEAETRPTWAEALAYWHEHGREY